MKLQLAGSGVQNLFTAYGAGYVAVNQTRHTESLIVLPNQPVETWPPRCLEDLGTDHFEAVLRHSPEIILLGTGTTLRFPSNEIRRALANTGIGLEIMDTFAACRTYNILAGEGRKVAAALLIPQ
ncbi:MAG: Mth938-like domain-containing protein [Sulfuricella sp.]|nr:Mth938-like domain-containing protein [Sulfuricella sp.]